MTQLMESTHSAEERPAADPPHDALQPSDSLATGVMLMLSLTVLQRIVGFGRSILFCWLLTDVELGAWSLAFSFLILATPVVLLGVPGSFGRYVEFFRQRGQLRIFLRRTSLACGVLALLSTVGLLFTARPFALLIFNDAARTPLVYITAAALASVVGFSYCAELLTALRQVRTVSLMQLANSIAFATIAVAFLLLTDWGAWGVIAAYGAAGVLGLLPAASTLARVWCDDREAQALSHGELWGKLLPFAGWVWATALLANLFETADRYMIVHFGGFTPEAAAGLVGQYHSSRVVPLLLMSLAFMVSGVVLPYLCSDWEQGNRRQVGLRINLTLKLVGYAFLLASVGILLASPLLFDVLLAGRYNDGLAVLPWTLAYCVWASLCILAQDFTWVAERARLSSLALLIALAVNIALNSALLPLLGLLGAVTATALSSALSVVLLLIFSRRLGFTIQPAVWLVTALPLLLPMGILPAAIGLGLVGILAWRSRFLLSPEEKRMLADVALHYREKFRRFWPMGEVPME